MTCLGTREGVLDGGDPLLGLDGPCVLGPIDRERLRLMQKWWSGAGELALAAAATPDDDVVRCVNLWSSTSNQTLNNMGFIICKLWHSPFHNMHYRVGIDPAPPPPLAMGALHEGSYTKKKKNNMHIVSRICGQRRAQNFVMGNVSDV